MSTSATPVQLVDPDTGVPYRSGGGTSQTATANGADVAEGSTTDAPYSDTTGASPGSVVSLLKGQYVMQRVVGNIADGAADSGNPVKAGGIFSTTLPTYTSGSRTTFQMTNRGEQLVSISAGGIAVGTTKDDADNKGVASQNSFFPVLSRGTYFNGSTWDRVRGDTSGAYAVTVASPAAVAGITPVTGQSVFSLAVKASSGNLYSASMTAGATAGYFIAYNGAVPAAGATLTAASILNVAQVSANGTANFGGNSIPDRFSSAVSLLFSTNLTTFTAPANPAQFIRGSAV